MTPRKPAGKGILICKDKACTYEPVEGSEELLKTLLVIYRQGLIKPLHFFPRSSFAYAEAMEKHGDEGKALAAARRTWDSDFGMSERDDPYFCLCFSKVDPLDEEFRELAVEVFGPVLRNERKE
jgi:exodeoxyribonuclease V gamma subunit